MSQKRPNKTSIQISIKLWKQLNDYKVKPSQSFNDIITHALNKDLNQVKGEKASIRGLEEENGEG